MTKVPRWMMPIMLAAVAAMQAGAQGSGAQARPTVLFVCEHGNVKSLLAKVFFERYADEIGLDVEAVSRGTRPDSVVPAWMQSSLATDHVTLGAWRPQALALADLLSASYVVSFDVPTSATVGARAPHVQWDGLPSVSANYASGRDAIRARVRLLADSLKRASAAR